MKNNIKTIDGKLLMGPGPTNIDRRIKLALSKEPLSHLDPDFFSILDNYKSLH